MLCGMLTTWRGLESERPWEVLPPSSENQGSGSLWRTEPEDCAELQALVTQREQRA